MIWTDMQNAREEGRKRIQRDTNWRGMITQRGERKMGLWRTKDWYLHLCSDRWFPSLLSVPLPWIQDVCTCLANTGSI